MIAVDSETTGLDFFHGAKPFLITICNKELENNWWEWDVNPITRKPHIPKSDKRDIKRAIQDQEIIFHNSKFDVKGMSQVNIECDWEYIHDTLIMAHIVDSGFNLNLTTLVLKYLGVDVQPFEDAVKEATNAARRHARSKYPEWVIAKKGLPNMPSIGGSDKANDEEKPWKNDMWLPRAIAQEENYPDDHPWWTVCSTYANSDTATTVQLFHVLKEILKEKGLWGIYIERLKILPILYGMEMYGIGANRDRLEELKTEYTKEYDEQSAKCVKIAKGIGFDLSLPTGAINNSLREFCFDSDKLDLPIVKETQKGNPSLDKEAKEIYLLTLQGNQKSFIESLDSRSKLATSLGYMESYQKFMLSGRDSVWSRLHSSLNPTGTATLRMSSQNPNQQQISKKTDSRGRNLRYIFGPSPGYEWWSLDYDNLELRIPAYECGETAMLELFESPDSAPFFGSYHLLIVSILHPKEWKKCISKFGEDGAAEGFKSEYKNTLYQWTKNGNFAELYGAVDKADGQGTADKAFHLKGAQSKIASRLKEKNALNKKWIDFANENGFVETLPDKVVCPERGYPLTCLSNSWGRIKPTLPLNYHVQGTACWIMMRAMLKVQDYLNTLGDGYRLIMNVHDELSVEMPFRANKKNLPKAKIICSLMESIGEDVGVKLTCGIDYHPYTWSQTV